VGEVSFQLTDREVSQEIGLEHQRVGFAVEAGQDVGRR
jgi:hypothetical protein